MTRRSNFNRCEALVALLGPEKVSFPSSTAYNASLASYFSLQSSAIHPECFVAPQTTGDVSAVVKLLTSDPEDPAEFAIRSRGHMWIPNASNVQEGITINLGALDSIDLNADKTIASIGPGAAWDDVYAKLDLWGLSVAGGRIGGVGVGGLTVGGGISHFGPEHGWTCDTASAFEVVLADGSVVTATEKDHTDLFYGLQGGGNNFGIVTRVDFATFEQGPLWIGTIYNPVSAIEDYAKIVANMTAVENYDNKASFIAGFGYSQSQNASVIANQLVYTKPVADHAPQYYQDIVDLPSVFSNISVANMSELATQGKTLIPSGAARYLFATTTFEPTEAMIRGAFDVWSASVAGVKNISGLSWSLSMEMVPEGLYQRKADSNSLGLTDRNGTRAVILLTVCWQSLEDDEHVHAAVATLVTALEDKARSLDAYDPFLYLNYAAPWQRPIASYGDDKVKTLQALRTRVDPKGVFTRRVPGGFKIPDN
ncbi:FAD-binding domain-containing protein [Ophiobolus disseminans]|uniref:FAD-binding domain-containing protein n=1 Tax=Ophiobolus disseminans TaxID=1469910 RepID=A0A6A7A750_9PLEO|nr:FAD-binding domain-containing protein [Ophiobolus disseminans]